MARRLAVGFVICEIHFAIVFARCERLLGPAEGPSGAQDSGRLVKIRFALVAFSAVWVGGWQICGRGVL